MLTQMTGTSSVYYVMVYMVWKRSEEGQRISNYNFITSPELCVGYRHIPRIYLQHKCKMVASENLVVRTAHIKYSRNVLIHWVHAIHIIAELRKWQNAQQGGLFTHVCIVFFLL